MPLEKKLEFSPSQPLTLGVEMELQLLDPKSLALVPKAPQILGSVPRKSKDRIKEEFIQSMVEITTGICQDVSQVEKDLIDTYELLEKLAKSAGCILYASSLHPFSSPYEQQLTKGKRYARILEELRITVRRLITQGLHIHVGIDDREELIRVFDRMRTYLPILLALTTSSPYFQGYDTGLHSFRSKLFEALPRTGIPDAMGSWHAFSQLIRLLKRFKAIEQIRDIWWDVRPHPEFGTIEIRICDVPSRMQDILGICALVQCIVSALLKGRLPDAPGIRQFIVINKWQAVRYGLKGRFIYPNGIRCATFSKVAQELIQALEAEASKLSCKHYLSSLERVIKHGPSSNMQRHIYRQTLNFQEMINRVRKEFWK